MKKLMVQSFVGYFLSSLVLHLAVSKTGKLKVKNHTLPR